METMTVYWKGKFGGQPVVINAADFDPAIHSTKPFAAAVPKKADEPKKAV